MARNQSSDAKRGDHEAKVANKDKVIPLVIGLVAVSGGDVGEGEVVQGEVRVRVDDLRDVRPRAQLPTAPRRVVVHVTGLENEGRSCSRT